MQIFRSNHLDIVDGRLVSTPTEFLDLYLDSDDIGVLANPSRRYAVDRFMGCADGGGVSGWMAEDKVHVRLDRPVMPEQAMKLAELSLDPGGDLYFTIWDGRLLRSAKEHEEFTEMSTFVTSDPSDKLKAVGIEVIRLHQLSDLARELGALK